MPTNIYFTQGKNSEQYLYEDLIIESIKIHGIDVYYLPREIFERDNVLNEVVESNFDDSYIVECYIENTEAFEGEGNLLSKFGLEIRDEATFIFAKRTWENLVGRWEVNQIRPNEGDIIYLPLSNSLFEISFVEHESPFFQLKNLTVYKIQARLYEANEGDTFNTGLDIDDIENKYDYQTVIGSDMTNSNIVFAKGDIVYQEFGDGSRVYGEIASFGPTGNANDYTFAIINSKSDDGSYKSFTVGGIMQNQTQAGFANITSIGNNLDITGNAQNNTVEDDAANIIDFNESNPFGEI